MSQPAFKRMNIMVIAFSSENRVGLGQVSMRFSFNASAIFRNKIKISHAILNSYSACIYDKEYNNKCILLTNRVRVRADPSAVWVLNQKA